MYKKDVVWYFEDSEHSFENKYTPKTIMTEDYDTFEDIEAYDYIFEMELDRYSGNQKLFKMKNLQTNEIIFVVAKLYARLMMLTPLQSKCTYADGTVEMVNDYEYEIETPNFDFSFFKKQHDYCIHFEEASVIPYFNHSPEEHSFFWDEHIDLDTWEFLEVYKTKELDSILSKYLLTL